MARFNQQKVIILAGVAAMVLIGVAGYLKLTQPKPLAGSIPPPPAQTGQSPGSASNAGPAHDTPAPTATPTTTSPSSPGTKLAAPTGQLLSNHSVSLSSTTPESKPDEDSTCQTVLGATCDIRLTGPSGQVITLGAKSVNDQGGVEFVWNAKDKGLTPGRWKVEAVATKDGQGATSSPDYLQVSS